MKKRIITVLSLLLVVAFCIPLFASCDLANVFDQFIENVESEAETQNKKPSNENSDNENDEDQEDQEDEEYISVSESPN